MRPRDTENDKKFMVLSMLSRGRVAHTALIKRLYAMPWADRVSLLRALERDGWVSYEYERVGERGRQTKIWSITPEGAAGLINMVAFGMISDGVHNRDI